MSQYLQKLKKKFFAPSIQNCVCLCNIRVINNESKISWKQSSGLESFDESFFQRYFLHLLPLIRTVEFKFSLLMKGLTYQISE